MKIRTGKQLKDFIREIIRNETKNSIINEIWPFDNKKKKQDADTAAKTSTSQQAKDMGLTHLGGGYYGKKEGDLPTHKSDGGKITTIPSAELDKAKEDHAEKFRNSTGRDYKSYSDYLKSKGQGLANINRVDKPDTKPQAIDPHEFETDAEKRGTPKYKSKEVDAYSQDY